MTPYKSHVRRATDSDNAAVHNYSWHVYNRFSRAFVFSPMVQQFNQGKENTSDPMRDSYLQLFLVFTCWVITNGAAVNQRKEHPESIPEGRAYGRQFFTIYLLSSYVLTNSPMVQQLTRELNIRSRSLNADPMGDISLQLFLIFICSLTNGAAVNQEARHYAGNAAIDIPPRNN